MSNIPKIRFSGFTDEWEGCRFSDLVETRRGLTYKPSDIRSAGVRVLRSSNIDGDTFDLREDDIFVCEDAVNIECARDNDILITAANGSSQLVGKHAVISGLQGSSAVQGGFMLIGTAAEPYFINASMSSPWYRTFIDSYVSGGNDAIGNLSKSALDSQEIFVPEVPEQRKIGSLFRSLDCLIALHQRRKEKFVLLKAACLNKMFPAKESRVPQLRFKGFNGNWEECRLEDIVDVRSGRDYKHLKEGDIPVYGTGGYMLSVNEALSYSEDAIGIGRKGTIDKPYILKAPFWTVDTLFYAVPRENCELNFAFDLFQKIDWKKKDESTGVPSLSKTAINSVKVMAPGRAEQKLIGDYFAEQDSLILLYQRKEKKLRMFKQALLNNMFV